MPRANKWRKEAKNGIIRNMPQKIKNTYHLLSAIMAGIFFAFPSRKLIVIGVTGTDGKTTTASLICHILNSSGKNASMISSVGAVIGGKNYDVGFHVTTPSPFLLQRFIAKIAKSVSGKKESYLVLETTSHALDQYRIFGIRFTIGVLTNITHEHLDYHKTYEAYIKTKAKLLRIADTAIINRDDESYKLIKSKIEPKNRKLITYGLDKDADVNPHIFPFKTNLIGEFNKYNILAAVSVCKVLGGTDADIREGIASFIAPLGRQDIVYNKDFTVMIDFAHTPNAFEEILSSIRSTVSGRVIHVFGSAGLRDKTKRPKMGEVSSRYADVIILTSEDPRTESAEKIMGEIEAGIKTPNAKSQILKIKDRKQAVEAAIKMAKKGDFVILTGKSHEKSMNYGKGEESWDEYETVKNALDAK